MNDPPPPPPGGGGLQTEKIGDAGQKIWIQKKRQKGANLGEIQASLDPWKIPLKSRVSSVLRCSFNGMTEVIVWTEMNCELALSFESSTTERNTTKP